MDRLERKLDAIMRHLNISENPATQPIPAVQDVDYGMAEVDDLLARGNKIGAIKQFRRLHPEVSLKQAKDAVEARDQRRYY